MLYIDLVLLHDDLVIIFKFVIFENFLLFIKSLRDASVLLYRHDADLLACERGRAGVLVHHRSRHFIVVLGDGRQAYTSCYLSSLIILINFLDFTVV